MKLTWEETKDVANYLDDKISNHFHDALFHCLSDKYGWDFEVNDEDIIAIKEQLKRILC
tara:strand:+ start:310 stop:486 length:177 start_codon:yes stop_codon:yes gene_type:complete